MPTIIPEARYAAKNLLTTKVQNQTVPEQTLYTPTPSDPDELINKSYADTASVEGISSGRFTGSLSLTAGNGYALLRGVANQTSGIAAFNLAVADGNTWAGVIEYGLDWSSGELVIRQHAGTTLRDRFNYVAIRRRDADNVLVLMFVPDFNMTVTRANITCMVSNGNPVAEFLTGAGTGTNLATYNI